MMPKRNALRNAISNNRLIIDLTARLEQSKQLVALAPLLLSIIIALSALEIARGTLLVNLEEAALGTETVNVYATPDGTRVLCKDAIDHSACLADYRAAGAPAVTLWLGNSQLAAINRFKAGDATAPILLSKMLAERGRYTVTYAQPNGNLFEQGVTFVAATESYDVRRLILPVFLDDLREQGLREGVRGFLNDLTTLDALRRSYIWPKVEPYLRGRDGEDGQAAPRLREWVEDAVVGWLDAHWPLWERRANLRGMLGFMLHTLRNKTLGITAQTKRPVEPALFDDRLAMLAALIAEARSRSVAVLLYIPPYRQDISGPYVAADYDRLKRSLAEMAVAEGVDFVNLEAIVPGPEWGHVTDRIFGFTDYDFMHFTADGHRRHADAVADALATLGE